MQINRYILLTFLTLPLLLCSTPSNASSNSDDHIAVVVAVRGEVFASNNSKLRKLLIKDPIFKSDIINTGKRGRIQMMFNDATIISLARKTQMAISDYQWDPVANKGAMTTKVKEGTFRIMGGAITKFSPKHFTTETPTATIGIRGSMYAGSVTKTSLSVVFQGGKGIDIMNAAGSVAITKPGFGTNVLGLNQAPLPPKKFTAVDIAKLNTALNGDQKSSEKMEEEAPQGDHNGSAGEEDGQSTKNDEADQAPQDENQDESGPPADEQAVENNDNEPPPPDENATPIEGQQEEQAPISEQTVDGEPPPEGAPLAPIAEGTPLPPSEQTVGDALPPPPGSIDQFGTDLSGPIIDPSVSDIISTSTVDSSQTATATDVNTTPASLPTNGVSDYSGFFTGTQTVSGDVLDGIMFLEVNWHSGKAFGIAEDKSPSGQPGLPAFFFGTVSGTSLVNIHIFGSDGGDPFDTFNHVSALEGTGSGSFLGTDFQFFDASILGSDFSLAQSGTPQEGSWSVTSTTSREPQDPLDKTSPTGSATWTGFAVGVGENVNDINKERKIWMSTPTNDLSFTVNKDNGTINGTIKAEQTNKSNFGAIDVTIGGAYGSAYVLDDAFAAILGCSGNCVNDDSGPSTLNAALNQHGNFLFTEDPNNQFSQYATWGYWEISHEEPDGPDPDSAPDMYHTHVPYSMWVAGEKTPASYVSNLINNTTFKGTYSGMAQGSRVITGGGVENLTNGHVNLLVDFGNAASINPVTGSITFDQKSLSIISAASTLTSGGFTAYFNNTGVTAGPNSTKNIVNGLFYGPKANTAAGNFTAEFATETYIGIFGGNLTTPAP